MSLFKLKWLRRFVRRHTRPIAEADAETWKKRISLAYMLLAWNGFGVVCYVMFLGKSDWAKFHGLKKDEDTVLSPAQQWTRILGIKDAKVYKISGLNVSSYEVHNDIDEEKQVVKQ